MSERICEIPGCGRRHEARGLCESHYARWKRTGDARPDDPLTPASESGRLCSVDGCARPHLKNGYCNAHALRVRDTGTANGNRPISRVLSGPENWRWLTTPTYQAVHFRIYALHGAASAYRCVDCGVPAVDWSYNRSGIAERVAVDHGELVTYSTDTAQYEPRCRACHNHLDHP